MKEGGFVVMPDHLITPGVPLADYQYYLERVRELRLRARAPGTGPAAARGGCGRRARSS